LNIRGKASIVHAPSVAQQRGNVKKQRDFFTLIPNNSVIFGVYNSCYADLMKTVTVQPHGGYVVLVRKKRPAGERVLYADIQMATD
jgi:hypothetical protein